MSELFKPRQDAGICFQITSSSSSALTKIACTILQTVHRRKQSVNAIMDSTTLPTSALPAVPVERYNNHVGIGWSIKHPLLWPQCYDSLQHLVPNAIKKSGMLLKVQKLNATGTKHGC